MKTGGVYDRSARMFALLSVVIGVVLVVSTLVRGGGLFSVGVLLGLAFVALGLARYRLQQKLSGER